MFFTFIIVLMLIYADSRTWSKLATSGSGPSPRDKLASAAVGENIYYFGGFGPKTSPAVRNYAGCFFEYSEL